MRIKEVKQKFRTDKIKEHSSGQKERKQKTSFPNPIYISTVSVLVL